MVEESYGYGSVSEDVMFADAKILEDGLSHLKPSGLLEGLHMGTAAGSQPGERSLAVPHARRAVVTAAHRLHLPSWLRQQSQYQIISQTPKHVSEFSERKRERKCEFLRHVLRFSTSAVDHQKRGRGVPKA